MQNISVLVVDDEPANVKLLIRILRQAGYSDVVGTTESHAASEIAAHQHPDLVLLDLHMPGVGGLEVMRKLNSANGWAAPFVIVLTGDDSPEAKARALSGGAKDFIAKPFDTNEVLLRIKNLGDLRLLHKQLHQSNFRLEEKVRARTLELEQARREVIERLGMAAEFRDDATGQHTRRVGIIAGAVASALGLDPEMVLLIERAAPLHDVGKIAIPDHVLLKPGPLNEEEMRIMRTHTTIGGRLLGSSSSPLLNFARDIALTHHERWDGAGYPASLSGADIPLPGRIVAIADFFDALSHDRPYRRAYERPDVLQFITAESGRHFDPAVVAAFLQSVEHT